MARSRFDWTQVSGSGYIYDNEKRKSVPIEEAVRELHERMVRCESTMDRLMKVILEGEHGGMCNDQR